MCAAVRATLHYKAAVLSVLQLMNHLTSRGVIVLDRLVQVIVLYRVACSLQSSLARPFSPPPTSKCSSSQPYVHLEEYAGCSLLCLSGKNVPLVAHMLLVVPMCGAAGVQGSGLASVLVLVLYSHKFYPLILALNASSPSSIVLKVLKLGKHKILHYTNFHRLSIDFTRGPKWTLFDLECS